MRPLPLDVPEDKRYSKEEIEGIGSILGFSYISIVSDSSEELYNKIKEIQEKPKLEKWLKYDTEDISAILELDLKMINGYVRHQKYLLAKRREEIERRTQWKGKDHLYGATAQSSP